MKVIRFDNEGAGNRAEYETPAADIRTVAQMYGRAPMWARTPTI